MLEIPKLSEFLMRMLQAHLLTSEESTGEPGVLVPKTMLSHLQKAAIFVRIQTEVKNTAAVNGLSNPYAAC